MYIPGRFAHRFSQAKLHGNEVANQGLHPFVERMGGFSESDGHPFNQEGTALPIVCQSGPSYGTQRLRASVERLTGCAPITQYTISQKTDSTS